MLFLFWIMHIQFSLIQTTIARGIGWSNINYLLWYYTRGGWGKKASVKNLMKTMFFCYSANYHKFDIFAHFWPYACYLGQNGPDENYGKKTLKGEPQKVITHWISIKTLTYLSPRKFSTSYSPPLLHTLFSNHIGMYLRYFERRLKYIFLYRDLDDT